MYWVNKLCDTVVYCVIAIRNIFEYFVIQIVCNVLDKVMILIEIVCSVLCK